MRLPALLSLAILAAGSGAAAADPLQFLYDLFPSPPETRTTYVERSLNHQAALTVEHPPVARNPYGRRGDAAAIAGFCREGGFVRRRDEAGRPVIVRQREVCDSVAPRTLRPGDVDPRPAWPERPAAVVRARG